MQETLAHISHWITRVPPLLKANKEPVADNPFYHLIPETQSDYWGSNRLGFIYQELCKRLFEQQDGYHLLADEVQLSKGKQTIGAIDFLLSHDSQIEHWEVALKFYLLKDGLWYGPNSQDRLDKKLQKMLSHQLKMSDTPEFRQRFPEIKEVEPKLLIQGRLYINPFSAEAIPYYCLEYELNREIITGYWCYQHQLCYLKETLHLVEKMEWIVGSQTTTKRPALQASHLEQNRPFHCQTDSGQFWMIVPNTWPSTVKL